MDKQEWSREQLIKRIEILESQKIELEAIKVQYQKTKETLRTQEEKFHFFFNTAPLSLIISNAHGDILNVNQALQELVGYTPEEITTMNITDFYADSKDRDHLLDLLNQFGRVSNFETKIKHKNGTYLTVLLNSDYLDIENTKLLLTSIHDVTQFKKIQKNLKETEDGYHLLFNNAPIGITVTDFNGNLIANNQALQELLDYNANELIEKNVRDFYFNTTERQHLLDLTQKLGVVRDFETKFRQKDGKVISVLINTDLIDFKEQSQVLLTSIRDITNLKRVEEELTKERDFTNAILDTAASLILVLNQEGVITRFNSACEKTTGYSFKEMEGQHIWDALSGNTALTQKMFQKLLIGNYPSIHENYWLRKDGVSRLISWINTVLLDHSGKVEYIVATGIDITEQRRAETELSEASRKLVIWVKELEERTGELNQLSEMGEQLQNCQNIGEACSLSAQYIQRLFPTSQGALYLISPSKDLAEAIEMWGSNLTTDKTFLPINCWAIRRGRPHIIDHNHPGLLCGHISDPHNSQYLCVPMLANGEIIGMIHLNPGSEDQDLQKSANGFYNEHKIQFIVTIAEHIALALSNLNLRETLRLQSIRDILTGLFNRRYMEESLERELRRAAREKSTVGLIMFDIDHFKEFNDLSGHDAGDALLRELGVFLRKNTRGGDIVCRFGGEEFIAVLPGATLDETTLRAEELRTGVKQLLVYHLGKPLGKCTLSLGVAAFPEHGLTSQELIKCVDTALYQAKQNGRDRVIVASL